jgi:hypothetical protein
MLFLGNSRTYYNHMPEMVRKLADSAGADHKYQITMRAPSRSVVENPVGGHGSAAPA